MVKQFITASTIVLLLAAFSPVSAQRHKQNSVANRNEVRFLDDIEAGFSEPANIQGTKSGGPRFSNSEPVAAYKKDLTVPSFSIENASGLQLKYSILLDAEVESVQNLPLFQKIDEWYGTRYVYGGTSKNGIDCSAFVQVIFAGVMGITLPRTAREQYSIIKPIDDEDLKEGDLVFFNTSGGVSHVGIYLQNNKFVHAATSSGVMISDLDDAYWTKRYIGSGRYQRPEEAMVLTSAKP